MDSEIRMEADRHSQEKPVICVLHGISFGALTPISLSGAIGRQYVGTIAKHGMIL